MSRKWYRNNHTSTFAYIHHVTSAGKIVLFSATGIVAVLSVSMFSKHWSSV